MKKALGWMVLGGAIACAFVFAGSIPGWGWGVFGGLAIGAVVGAVCGVLAALPRSF
jgi:hypothetical protein